MHWHRSIFWAFPLSLAAVTAFAFDSVTFITTQDHFTVKKAAHGYTVDGKPVLNTLLTTLDPYLRGQATDDCPQLTGKAPVIAKIGAETREFFINRGLVRVGGKCFFATGDGLFFLPMHRTWLVGPFREHVTLNSPLKISGGDTIFASLTKQKGEWADTNPSTELDWDFLQKFERSLSDFNVQYRVLLDAANGKPTVKIQSGSETYDLYKLGTKLWAIKRPGKKWLEAGDWGFWFDLDRSVWQDRRVPTIRKVEAAGTTTAQKLQALSTLDNGWSRTVEDFFQRRLLDNNEDQQIRLLALSRLRTKPSWRNMRVLMALTTGNPNDELLKEATQAMRARNPKGPTYSPGQSDRAQTVEAWQTWWQKNSTRKD